MTPHTNNWKNLKSTIVYLRIMKGMSLTLELDNTLILKWWIDRSFMVHPNMRIYIGTTGTMGEILVTSMLMK